MFMPDCEASDECIELALKKTNLSLEIALLMITS